MQNLENSAWHVVINVRCYQFQRRFEWHKADGNFIITVKLNLDGNFYIGRELCYIPVLLLLFLIGIKNNQHISYQLSSNQILVAYLSQLFFSLLLERYQEVSKKNVHYKLSFVMALPHNHPSVSKILLASILTHKYFWSCAKH